MDEELTRSRPIEVEAGLGGLTDRHEVVWSFENTDRARHVSVPDLALMADVGEVSSHAVHPSGLGLATRDDFQVISRSQTNSVNTILRDKDMDRDEALKLLRGGEEGIRKWNRAP